MAAHPPISRRARLTGLALVLLSASRAGAVAVDVPTQILSSRKDCLARQKSPASRAVELKARDTLMGTLTQQFCESPSAFCRSYEKMLGQGGDPQFVNSACENGSVPRNVAAPWNDASSYPIRFVQDAWRCAPAKPAASGPPGRVELDCLTVALPFACTDDRKTHATSPARDALLKAGAHFEARDPVCAIILQPPRGQSLAKTEQAALKTGLADLESKIPKGALSRSDEAPAPADPKSASSAALLREVASFAMVMRGAYSPQRLSEVKKLFGIARSGVLSYLQSIDAPRSILDTVRRTEFVDVSPFFTNPDHWTAPHLLKILTAAAQCRPPGTGPLGVNNAFNSNFEGSRQVMVCPNMLMHADFGNPRELLLVLSHELGHSIDACSLGVLQLNFDAELAGSYCKENVLKSSPTFLDATLAHRPEESEMNGFSNFVLRIKGQGGVAECLSERYVAGNPQAQVRLIQSILDQEDCLTPADRCALRQLQPKGALQYCPIVDYLGRMRRKYEPFFQLHRSSCPGLQTALNDVNITSLLGDINGARGIKQQVQVNEAFADYIAAGALPFALKNPALAAATSTPAAGAPMTGADRRADFLTLATVACSEQRPNDDNLGTHPDRDYRVSILSDAPQIRALLGCQQFDHGAKGARGAFSCENRMNPHTPGGTP